MTDLTNKQVLLIAFDQNIRTSLLASLSGCGLKVSAVFEASDVPATALDLHPDIIVIAVERGVEMNAYYLGHAAANRGIAVLFVAHNTTALALEALASAVPQSVVVEAFRPQDRLATKIIEALTARRFPGNE